MLTIILDNGHGSNTPGKCSPDKSLLEYKWAREIVDMLIKELKALGFNAVKLVPEDIDISLKERVRRANQIYKDTNKDINFRNYNRFNNGLNCTLQYNPPPLLQGGGKQ